MSKKFGKFLLFSALTGAAAYGAYSYLQKKEQTSSTADHDDADEDFDDFSEDLDEEPAQAKVRSYVSLNLDKAEAIATEAFHKAKEVITDSVNQVRETVKSVTEGQCPPETNFTDLTALQKEADESADTEEVSAEETTSSEEDEPVAETVNSEEEAVAEETFVSEEEPSTTENVTPEETVPVEKVSDPEKKAPAGQVEEFYDDTP